LVLGKDNIEKFPGKSDKNKRETLKLGQERAGNTQELMVIGNNFLNKMAL
jgi:hypothetical protein